MADNMDFIPQLTLDPTGTAAMASAEEPADEAAIQAERDKTAVKLELDQLSPEEQKVVTEFSKQINIMDTNAILSYGAASQKHISDFSDSFVEDWEGM